MNETYLFIGALGVLTVAGFGWLVFALNQHNKRLTLITQQLSTELLQVQTDLNAVINTAIGVGRHLSDLEKNLKQTAERQEELAYRDPDERTYSQAVKMFKRGESVEEVMDTTQLSRAEVELMRILHHRQGN